MNRDQKAALTEFIEYLDTLFDDKMTAENMCFWLHPVKECFSDQAITRVAIKVIEESLTDGTEAKDVIIRSLLLFYESLKTATFDPISIKTRLLLAIDNGHFNYKLEIENPWYTFPCLEHIF